MISFRNVSYTASGDDRIILHDVSFDIGKGNFAVLSGATGSGKSVVLKLLTAELRPTIGTVSIGDTTVSTLPKRHIPELRRAIGCVFQHFALLQEKTIGENVAFALEVQRKWSRKSITRKVESKLDEVGLLEKASVYPRHLSLGQQQRAVIARALVTEPLVLLADGVAAQLDDTSAESVFSILRNEHIRGMTILLTSSTERFTPLLPTSATLLEIAQGKVVRNFD